MTRILAIGGAVIKTAYDEIKEVAQRGLFDILIHNGGSLFHDFQVATETLPSHSYSLNDLLVDYEPNRKASELVWLWLNTGMSPVGTLTTVCNRKGIDVMLFTVLGADFWQLFDHHWETIAYKTKADFGNLCNLMEEPFHYICMGSAVVHPEVFTKALAVSHQKEFKTTVVDFLDMYRPRTRIAKYGSYCRTTHKEFLNLWIDKGLDETIKKYAL